MLRRFNMTNADPMPKLMDFIENELRGSGSRSISHEEDLLGGGHIDSMGIMRLVAFLESEFDVSVPPEDVTIEHFESARTISQYVQSSRAGSGS